MSHEVTNFQPGTTEDCEMEKLSYPEVVQTILKNHVRNRPNSHTEVQFIFDTESDRYQVLNIGWQDLTRVFGCIIYVEIKEGKIWIERDGTEVGVANQGKRILKMRNEKT